MYKYNSKGKMLLITFLFILYLSQFSFGFDYIGWRYPKNDFPTFYVNQDGTPDCSGEFSAIQSVLQTWNSVNTTYIDFGYGGTTIIDTRSYDGTNLMMWVESGWRSIFPGSYSVATNTTWYNQNTEEAYESDILFNGEDYLWSDNGTAGRYDVQNIATHEIGHSVGLDDLYGEGDTEKTMYYSASTGETKKSSLHSDDEDGARYVNFDPQTSGTLSENQIWMVSLEGSTIDLSNNLTIPSGKSLTIKSGVTVDLNGDYIECSGSGEIIREGNVTFNPDDIQIKDGSTLLGQYSTFQQAWDNVSSGQEVYLYTDTYTYTGDDIDMKPNVGLVGKSDNSTTINEKVNFNGDDYAFLSNVKVNKKISVIGSDYVDIGIRAGDSDCYIDISGSWVDVDYITSTVSQGQGIYAHSSSDLGVWGGSLRNKSVGVNLYLSTDAVIEALYMCQNIMDISAGSGCSADVYTSTFSSSTEGESVEGDVYWDDWDYCGIGKSVAPQSSLTFGKRNPANNGEDSGLSDYREAMGIYHTIKKNLRQDRKSGKSISLQSYASELSDVISKFKQIVTKYPESPYAISGLGRIASSYRILKEYETLESYVNEIANDWKFSLLKPYALSTLIHSYIKQKEYKKAIELSDQIIKESPEDLLIGELIYGKGIIYKYYVGDSEKAEKMFKMVVQNYPSHPSIQSAIDELKDMGIEYLSEDFTGTEEEIVEFSTANYPNPFNPETNIHFTLPGQGRVVLKIFDIVGREVARLIDEEKSAGRYTARWDGKDDFGRVVASGIYFYQIRFREKVLTRKIHLIR